MKRVFLGLRGAFVASVAVIAITVPSTLLLGVGQADAQQVITQDPDLELPLKIGRRSSPLGHYLAGLHAQNLTQEELAADFYGVTQSRYPALKELSTTRLSLLVAAGQIDEAQLFVKDVREVAPENGQANWVQFLTDFKRGRWDKADASAELMRQDERDVLLSTLASAWVAVGKRDETAFDAALAPLELLEGLESLVSLNRALAYDVLGQIDVAESHFDDALNGVENPSLRLLDLAGAFYERRGNFARARELYEAYLVGNPSELVAKRGLKRIEAGVTPITAEVATPEEGLAEMLYQVAILLYSDRQNRIAMTFANVARYLDSSMPYNEVLRGQLFEFVMRNDSRLGQELGPVNRFDEAIAAYRNVEDDHPLFWRAQAAAANVLSQQERYEEAEPILLALTEVEESRYDALLDLGDLFRFQEKYGQAAEYYELAVEEANRQGVSDGIWRLHYFLGIAYEREDEWDKAEAAFNYALELEPDQPQVLNYLAYSWIEQRRNFEQALDMLKTAVEAEPNDGYIVDSLGWVYYRLGQYEEAVPHLENAVELRPNDAVINDHLGDAYWRVGRKNEARFQWRRSLSFDPEPGGEADPDVIREKLERGLSDESDTPAMTIESSSEQAGEGENQGSN